MVLDIRRQRVIVEYSTENGYGVLFDDGAIRFYQTPPQALVAIRRAAGRGNREATITRIEWRNTPPDFIAPK
jgi:hypothetical protein